MHRFVELKIDNDVCIMTLNVLWFNDKMFCTVYAKQEEVLQVIYDYDLKVIDLLIQTQGQLL